MNHGSGNPGIDRLGDDERMCLLRAARAHLIKLLDDHHRLELLAATSSPAAAAADSAAVDVGCLQRGIAWLWRTQGP